jgi:sugar-specific transcriptional regulator TrmB
LRNIQFHKGQYTAEDVNKDFDWYDSLYNTKDMLMWYDEQKKHDLEYSEFLEEARPNKNEITENLGKMIKRAKHKIRIVQPYVQNVASFEDILKDALKRGVKVEVVTARYRD